jgi:hypothetical protein
LQSSLLSNDGRRGTLYVVPVLELKLIYCHNIGEDIVYDIGYDIEDAPKRRSLDNRYCIDNNRFDIEEKPSISVDVFSGAIINFDAPWTFNLVSISKFLFNIGYDIVMQYRDITSSKAKTLMSRLCMISGQCRDICRDKMTSTFSL